MLNWAIRDLPTLYCSGSSASTDEAWIRRNPHWSSKTFVAMVRRLSEEHTSMRHSTLGLHLDTEKLKNVENFAGKVPSFTAIAPIVGGNGAASGVSKCIQYNSLKGMYLSKKMSSRDSLVGDRNIMEVKGPKTPPNDIGLTISGNFCPVGSSSE